MNKVICINGSTIERLISFNFLCITIDHGLFLEISADIIKKKIQNIKHILHRIYKIFHKNILHFLIN